MKPIEWNSEKNEQLRRERGVSFEDVVVALETGDLLDVMPHHNQDQYSHQQILVIAIRGYAYLVPFVEDKQRIFLKTIFASRQATKDYLADN